MQAVGVQRSGDRDDVVGGDVVDLGSHLRTLYDAHYRRLVKVASFYLDDVADCEEVVQDAFVALLTGRRSVAAGREAAYLRSAVLNGARSALRKRAVRLRKAPLAEAPAASPEAEALGRASSAAVVAAIRTLPPGQADVVLLRYFCDLSEAEIADTLGISRGTVKSQAHRGLARLAELEVGLPMTTPESTIEDEVRRGLAEHASTVEPSMDAYSRLAQRVSGTRRPSPGPRIAWLVALGGVAAAGVVLVAALAARDEDDSTAIVTREPTETETVTTEPEPTATSEEAPVEVTPAPATAWPLGEPDETWPTSPEEAAVRFYAEIVGVPDVPVGPGPLSGRESVTVFRRDEAGAPTDRSAATVVVDRAGPALDRFRVAEVLSDDVAIDGVSRDGELVTVAGRGRGFEGNVVGRLWAGGAGLTEPTPVVAGAGEALEAFEIDLVTDAVGDAVVLVQSGSGADTDVPSVAMMTVDLGALPPSATLPPTADLGAAEGTASAFLTALTRGYEFAVTDSADKGGGTVEVTFGNTTRVTVVNDGEGWRATHAASDALVVTESVVDTEQLSVMVAGEDTTGGLGFNVEVIDATDTIVASEPGGEDGSGTFTVDLALASSAQGPGWIVLTGPSGSNGPTAVTIVPVDLPAIDPTNGGSTCSAADMTPPGAQDGLPEAVAAKRDAIVDAAVACDIDGLVALTSAAGFTASFGADEATAVWTAAEARGEPVLEALVAHLALPYRTSPEGTYTWPSAFGPAWSTLSAAEMDALRELYTQEQLDSFAQFDGYIGWRIGITAEGEWTFFVSGD